MCAWLELFLHVALLYHMHPVLILQLGFHLATKQSFKMGNSLPVVTGPSCCRELSSFVFVFEGANRIVVEKPCYGHATYFFDLEEPLSVSSQASPPFSPAWQRHA